jgi:predicted nuclease of predicted toxin-antitoxin system
MRFIVDAQLPRRLSHWLNTQGHESVHTLDLPAANATEDHVIIRVAGAEQRTVISKDRDFFEQYVRTEKPKKLLFVSTGNLTNKDLLLLFSDYLETVVDLLEQHNVVELSNEAITVHF